MTGNISTQFMSPISKELEAEFAKAAAGGTSVDVADLAERLAIETTSSCTFGVKAGSFSNTGRTGRGCIKRKLS